ncbi:MAG: metal ABC transporter solute-binding protein, Zn/Mn family [Candidatus Nucleicultricaceae bacterium]
MADSTPPKIVASFSVLEDLIREIGGDLVNVETLVERNSDPHVFQPTPETIIQIQSAEMVFLNGLGFEPWLAKILLSLQSAPKQCIASDNITPRWIHTPQKGDAVPDPHAWHSLDNIEIYAKNIQSCLRNLLPSKASVLEKRYNAFIKNIRTLKARLEKEMESIPLQQRKIITGHDAFGYLGDEFHIDVKAPLGISTEEKASAKTVAILINQVKENGTRAIFLENLANSDLIKQIAQEVGVDISQNVLYADALSENGGPADTYLKMMAFNIESLIREMKKNDPSSITTRDPNA